MYKVWHYVMSICLSVHLCVCRQKRVGTEGAASPPSWVSQMHHP